MTEQNSNVLIFKGRANMRFFSVTDIHPVTEVESDHPWTGVDRLEMRIFSLDENDQASALVAIADSADDSSLYDKTTDGVLGVKFGLLQTVDAGEIPAGEYAGRLSEFEGLVQRQVLHEKTSLFRLVFLETDNP